MNALLPGLLDLIAPARCPGCDGLNAGLTSASPGFCEACADALEPAPRPQGSLAVAAWLYGGPLVPAIARLKYHGRTDLLRPLAAGLIVVAAPLAAELDVVTAVPLHPRRLWERGYNQSALLARAVSRALGLPFEPALLTRVRATEQQAKRELSARAGNVRGAFRAGRVAARRVLVIDDVRTTGATLEACNYALSQAGAGLVRAAVVASAESERAEASAGARALGVGHVHRHEELGQDAVGHAQAAAQLTRDVH